MISLNPANDMVGAKSETARSKAHHNQAPENVQTAAARTLTPCEMRVMQCHRLAFLGYHFHLTDSSSIREFKGFRNVIVVNVQMTIACPARRSTPRSESATEL